MLGFFSHCALLFLRAFPAAAEPDDIEVFVREGCPHCAEAKVFLAALQHEQPRLRIGAHQSGECGGYTSTRSP